MVRLSPDGTRAFVTSRGAEGTLSIIALAGEAPKCWPRAACSCRMAAQMMRRRMLATGHHDPDGLAVSSVRVAVLERSQR